VQGPSAEQPAAESDATEEATSSRPTGSTGSHRLVLDRLPDHGSHHRDRVPARRSAVLAPVGPPP